VPYLTIRAGVLQPNAWSPVTKCACLNIVTDYEGRNITEQSTRHVRLFNDVVNDCSSANHSNGHISSSSRK